MSKLFKHFPLKKAKALYKDLYAGYEAYYKQLSNKSKLLAQQKSPSNSESEFWNEIIEDIKEHIDPKFRYAKSTVHKVFFDSNKRSYRIYEIDCLKELALFYKTNIDNSEEFKTLDSKRAEANRIARAKLEALRQNITSEKTHHDSKRNHLIAEALKSNAQTPAVKTDELEKKYFKRLSNEFNQIRLDVVGFKMSIEHFIKIPLLKYNHSLREQLESFKKQKETLNENYDLNKPKIDDISKKIREVERILDEEHDILDIISFGHDVFIEAPAGNGKSTLLRWLTYQFSSTNKGFFPIFIELMYNTSNDLVGMIEEKLNDYGLDSNTYKKNKILLLLDGFDQFTGNKTKLFSDVHRLKRKYAIQIIFSGRNDAEASKYGLELVLYNLKVLKDRDIKNIFLSYLGKKKGQTYFDYIANRSLTNYLEKPLYLTFLLAYIKAETDKNILDIDDIIPLIINQGRLLQSLIVERFIKKYEKDADTDRLEWEVEKTKEIELLCFLSYQMTYHLKNIEVIEKSRAEEIIEKQCRSHKSYKTLTADTVIKSFLKHNILYFKNGLLSFDKKELRLFFTAFYLKSKIKNYRQFSKQKQQLLKITSGNENIWDSIEKYLIGFMDADVLLKSFRKVDFNKPIVIHEKLMAQFQLALEFINQRNYPKNNAFINETYLFDCWIQVTNATL